MSQPPKIINCLYSHFKNSPKKLKIICDWDEVIQPHEPFALWMAKKAKNKEENGIIFAEFFKDFWEKVLAIEYSPYGSKMKEDILISDYQQSIKNSPNFYQQTPFLTIAKELLKLLKENKVEKLIFLSAYDKRKFPNEDPRKKQIFKDSFGKLANCSLELIGFDSEKKGANKADWIKEKAADFDMVIDDNPHICEKVAKNIPQIMVFSPHYPAVENQHYQKVLLIKTSVSNLKKTDF